MTDEPKQETEKDIHRLVANGLAIFGKAEQWTAEEIRKFALWLEGRL